MATTIIVSAYWKSPGLSQLVYRYPKYDSEKEMPTV